MDSYIFVLCFFEGQRVSTYPLWVQDGYLFTSDLHYYFTTIIYLYIFFFFGFVFWVQDS